MDPDQDLEAGNLALAFLNTLRLHDGGLVDGVASPQALATWLARTGVLTDDATRRLAVSPPEARTLLGEAHRLRGALREAVEDFARGAPLPQTLLPALNRALTHRRTSLRAAHGPNGLELLVLDHPGSVPGLLAPVAEAAVELFSRADPGRVRQCRAHDCILWFVDQSKNGSRKWCSMARCGNRAKVAAHYRRERD